MHPLRGDEMQPAADDMHGAEGYAFRHVNIPYPPMTVGGDSLFTRGTGDGFKFYIKRDAVGVVPYEPAQSLKNNDTRGKTVRPCHVNIPYPPMTVGGDVLRRPALRETRSVFHPPPFVIVRRGRGKAF